MTQQPQEQGGRIAQARDGMNVIFVHSLLDDAGLSLAAFRVYCHIARRAGQKGHAWPGIASVAKVCDLSENTVRKGLRELEERRMLQIRHGGGGRETHVYYLTAADEWTGNFSKKCDSPPPVQILQGFKKCTPAPQNVNPTPSKTEPKGVPVRSTNEGIPKGTPVPPEPRRSGSCGGDAPPVQQAAIPLEFAAIVTGAAPPNDLPPAAKDQCAVGPLQVRVGLLRGRRPNTPWLPKEIRQWKLVAKTLTVEDLELMEAYYSAPLRPGEKDIRRRDIYTLLNNWAGELDRARAYKATLTPTPTNGRHKFNPDA